MTRLIAHEHTQVPPSEAEACIERYFEAQGNTGSFDLHLHVSSKAFGIGGGLSLEKDVVARFTHRTDATYRNRLLTIAWEADGDGAFPKFEGTLEAIADDYAGGSVLVLRGSYEAPGGIPGQIFDATVGFWIARATARDLLQQIREGIERLYDLTRSATKTSS